MRRLLHTVMSGKGGRDTTFEVSRRKILLATTTLAAASALGSTAHAQTAQAQTVTTAQTQAKYTPEQAKALEDWTYAVALDAANWGSPAVIMYNLRANDAVGAKPKAAPNSIWRMEDISTPQLSVEAGYVTPNVNVIYGFGFLDLGPEPIILTVPDFKRALLSGGNRRHVLQRLCLRWGPGDWLQGRQVRSCRPRI